MAELVVITLMLTNLGFTWHDLRQRRQTATFVKEIRDSIHSHVQEPKKRKKVTVR